MTNCYLCDSEAEIHGHDYGLRKIVRCEDCIYYEITTTALAKVRAPDFPNAMKTKLIRDIEDIANKGGEEDIRAKRLRLRLHLNPFFKDKSLVKITDFDVKRYQKHRQGEGAALGSINRELAVLSHLFTKAVEWKWIDHRPANIKRPKEDSGRTSYLTVEQIRRLLAAAKEDSNPHVYPFIVIGLETGMRRMEILSIRLEHIELERQHILVPSAKAGPRNQPITEHLARFLRGYIEAAEPGQEWLHPAPASKTGHTVAIEKPFRRVVAAAGLDPTEVVRHTLRHTAITHLVQEGVDLPTVQRISGHKTLSMVAKYSHQSGDHIRKAMERLDKRYRGTG